MIRIGQASMSEDPNNRIYGMPPNQLRTGVTASKPEGNLDGELNIVPFYYSNWKAVFRPKSSDIAEKSARIVEAAIGNGLKVGYGQNWINQPYPMSGLFDELMQLDKPNPWDIKGLCNCTCATLMGAGYYFAGVYEPKFRLLNTYEEERDIMATGKFMKLTDEQLLKSARGVKRGDIFWRIGHTMMALDSDDELIETPYVTANCAYCNLRDGDSVNNKILATIKGGEYVGLISWSENDWGQVDYNGLRGYISGKYIAPITQTLKITGNTWLRETPGTSGTPLIVVPQGSTSCFYVGHQQRVGTRIWYEIAYSGFHGWGSSLYLKKL